MDREKRIAWARRKAAEDAPERARQRQQEAEERSTRIAAMGSSEANRLAYALNRGSSIPWLGSVSTPHEWSQAVSAARAMTIEAAHRRRTVTYGELRIAAHEATGMKVGHNQYAELAMSINKRSDGCLLSAIIVKADSGKPGAGFLSFARSEGIDQPVTTLQRQVFERFVPDRRPSRSSPSVGIQKTMLNG